MSTTAPARTTLLTALALSGALALASCSSTPQIDDPSETATAPTATAETSESSSPSETASASPDATQGGDAAGPGIEGAIAAIELAESETGATAFEIDDEDDDASWEVDLADGTEQITVLVSGDGASVVSTEREGDVDDDDRAALDAAGISLVEAIEAAAAEAGDAAFDDASLEDDSDGPAWEVSFRDEIEVHVSVADGSILRVDR
ncbi:PepSY domain-containing protein [Agrococcus citreus]|uniref:PepSY domain-containing protein n=1 Tax=Agrococcus citreus TaxID=84643 RepID=A0ABN1YTZ1_9MICO